MNPIHLYANLFLERRWLVGRFIVIVTAVAIYGHLTTANSNDHFASLPERRQEVQQLLETRFASNAQRDAVAVDELKTAALKASSGQLQAQLNQWQWDNFDNQDFFIVVQGEDVFRPQTIAALREMAAKVNQLDAVYRVLWLDQVPIFNRFGVPGPILPADDAADDVFAKAKTNVLAHPIAPGYLVSEDGTVLLFSVAVQWHQVQQVAKMVQDVRSTAKGILAERNVDVDFYLAGRIPIMVEQRASLRRNQVWFQFLGYGLAFFITMFLFRGVGAVMIVAGAPALGIVWATGILKLIDAPTNMLTSIILPVLVSMVGLTDGIHLMMHIRKCRARGVPAPEAAAMSVRLVGLACFLTSFTTCVGFGSLRLAHSEYIRDFGYACAIGVVISFFAVITVIPFLCTTFLGKRIDRGHDKDILTHQLSRSEWVIDRVIARPRKHSWWAIGLTLVLLAASFSLRPDNNTKSSLPKNTESFQVLSLCDEKLGGIDQAQVLIRWDQGTDRKTFLEVIDKVERTLDAEPLFGYSLSVHDLYESLQPGYRQQAADERLAPAIAMLVHFECAIRF
ncbi:MAG: MMPL family transporter [Pirellulaceae bacterium]